MVDKQKVQEKKVLWKGSQWRIWMVLSIAYFLLFSYTGYLAFLTNNQYATNDKNFEIISESIGEQNAEGDIPLQKRFDGSGKEVSLTEGKAALVEDLLVRQAKNYESVNSLAAQSFNVVLGAILGFLSASWIRWGRSSKEPKREGNNDV